MEGVYADLIQTIGEEMDGWERSTSDRQRLQHSARWRGKGSPVAGKGGAAGVKTHRVWVLQGPCGQGTPRETTVTGARHTTTTSSVQPSVATGAHGGGPPVTRWG
jgi:hypothetical protein